jgi:hypothetical protein
MLDSTFEWTDSVNKYLQMHLDIKNRYIIYASFLMDLMFLTFMTIFYFHWKTYRIVLAYIIFFCTRAFI